jgi:hypothetical protein
MKPGYVCPYNKRIAIKAFEDINRLISALGALIENTAVAAGVKLKGSDSLFDIREKNTPGECPMERMEEKTTVGSGEPGISGQVQEHGG